MDAPRFTSLARSCGFIILYAFALCILGLPLFFNLSSEAVDTCWTYTVIQYGTNCNTLDHVCPYSYGYASPHKVCSTHTSTGYHTCKESKSGTTTSAVYNYWGTCRTKPCNYYSYFYCVAYSFREAAPNVFFLYPCVPDLITPGCTTD